MWHATILWFGSLHAGYDDYTINLFQQETGIRVPVDEKAADRFSRRYLFLMHTCRSAWVAWRCRKIHQLLCKIRDVIINKRPDLRLTITFWNEMTIPALLGSIGASHQLYARLSNVELYREAGLDIGLIGNEPGIEFDLQFEHQRDRSGWGAEGDRTPIEQATMFRDHDFLDKRTLDAFHNVQRSGVFIFNSWVEAWGQHKWFPCEPDDTQAAELAVMSGKPAEGIFRMNSEYPKDGFWWDSQLRITPAHPGGVHFMEHYAHAIAELDASRITRGGLFLDKAHSEEIARFALAYRALPKQKFETVGSKTDPVAIRTLVYGNKRYMYMVNRDYYPVAVEITFNQSPDDFMELATGAIMYNENPCRLTLAPYELRSFSMNPETEIISLAATPPEGIVSSLMDDANHALAELRTLRDSGYFIPGMEQMEHDIISAVDEGRMAWLRRALSGYIVRKCHELLKN